MSPRTIVITGVSRGLGRALVDAFAPQGHRVIGCARSPEAIGRLAEHYARPHSFSAVDVSDYREVTYWAHNVLDTYGAPDLLVNNAALINTNARLWEVEVDEFAKLTDVNINGVFHVVKAFVPAMVERGSGVIVNLSSGWGRSVSPEVAPYCTTKWAIEGMTRALAEELPRGMAAIPLNPGVIHTEMLERCWGDGAASFPRPEAWARRAAPFLLGLGPEHNGQPLTVPGS